jgi:aspartate kinase
MNLLESTDVRHDVAHDVVLDRSPNGGHCTDTTASNQLRVLKFGGSSVGTAEAIEQVVRIVMETSQHRRVVVVVSALARVTNLLEAIVEKGADGAIAHLIALYRRHVETAQVLLSEPYLSSYKKVLGRELSAVIPAIRRVRQDAASCFDADTILAAGERFSAPLIAAALTQAGREATPVDASALIQVCSAPDRQINEAHTTERIRSWYSDLSPDIVPVVTGFIGSAPCGGTVTLGRGGSDFTAALLASALSAEVLERWTDVDGLYTADPEIDPSAKKFNVLRMEDAAFLNRADRLGMHRHTLEPLLKSCTPLHVKSFTRPGSGTLIIPTKIEA